MPTPRFLSSLRAGPVESQAATGADGRKDLLLSRRYESGGRHLDPRRGWDVDRAVREAFESVVWAYKSVDAIAGSACRLRFGVRFGDGDTARELPDLPLVRLLNGKANPYETGRVLRKRLSQQLLLSPRGAFVEIVRSRRDEPLELHLLPPGRTRPVPGRDENGKWLLVHHFEVTPPAGYGPVRTLSVEQVRWLREPHPTDPYRSMTPLEAAGLSVELDHYARLYNHNFMLNDGRPGGVLGVDGEMEDDEMDRVERKFGGGIRDAGRLTVIAGDLDYVDTSTTPRDAQYGETTRTSKVEVLAAFGVPESQLGHASDSKFANAEVEAEAFWVVTMLPHLDVIDDGFDEDTGDDTHNFHDVSGIDALGRVERRRREELRKELEQGAISPDEYRVATGREAINVPAMRAYYLAAGKVAVAANPDEQDEVSAIVAAAKPAPAAPTPAPADGQSPAGDGAGTGSDRPALPAGAPGRGDPEAEPPDGGEPPLGGAPAGGGAKAADASSSDGEVLYEPPADDGEALEAQVAAALVALADRMATVVEARLTGARARHGTRHWDPPGEKPIDAAYIAQTPRWQADATSHAERLLLPAADGAAEALLAALAPEGKALPREVARAVRDAADEAVVLVGKSAARQAELLLDLIAEADAGGASIPDIVAAVRRFAARETGWAAGLAIQAVTAALEGARDAVARTAGRDISRRWRTRGDDKVRATHRTAAGQERKVGEAFDVGGAELRYPGDPKAPIKETANCFPHGTLVRAASVEVSFRRWYEGEMVTVHTADGHVLAGTPNHPVLAERGWVPLGEVKEGDDLVCERPTPGAGLVGALLPHVEDEPAPIGEVHRAAQQAGVLARVAGSGVDFHGDGREGEVHVVRADSPLQVGVATASGQQPGEAHLAAADALKRALAAERAGGEFLVGGAPTTDGAVGGLGESAAPFGAEVLGAEPHGGGPSPSRDPGEVELPRDGRSRHAEPGRDALLTDTLAVKPDGIGTDLDRGVATAEPGGLAPAAEDRPGAAQPRVRGLSGPAEGGGDVVHPLAALVGFSRVTEVVRADFAGHVYNLQTATGVYLANGILVHNCRCRVQYRSVATGRFVPTPPGEVDRRPRAKVRVVGRRLVRRPATAGHLR